MTQEIDFDKIKLGQKKSGYAYVVDGVGFKNREDAVKNVNGEKIELPKTKQKKDPILE